MKVTHYRETPARAVNIEGASGVKMRWLISQKEKAPNFVMRMFEIKEGGHTPLHSHSMEHEVFVLEGEGVLVYKDNEYPFSDGFAIFIPPDDMHQFKNTGKGLLRFLCMIPNEKS